MSEGENAKLRISEMPFCHEIAQQLSAREHDVRTGENSVGFGREQNILRGDHGALVWGTETRTDSSIASF